MALTEGFGRGTSELDHHRDSSSPGQRRSELASLSFLFFDNTVQAAPAGQAGDPNTNTDLTFSHQPGGFYISLAAVGPPLMTSTHVGVECPLTCDARTRAKANEPIAILKVQLQYQYTTGHGLHNLASVVRRRPESLKSNHYHRVSCVPRGPHRITSSHAGWKNHRLLSWDETSTVSSADRCATVCIRRAFF